MAKVRKKPVNKPVKKKPVTKKPATKTAALVATYVSTVNSRADAAALVEPERSRFVAAASTIVGGKTFAQTVDNLSKMLMGVIKLKVTRGAKHVYDVWINTVKDDGAVMTASSAKHAGIGISQGRVYDKIEQRDAECEAIHRAIYRGKVKWPPFEEWRD